MGRLLGLGALALGVMVADAPYAMGHGGGLNHCGCHHNRSTGECHCHHDYGCGCECEPDRCDAEPESSR